MTISGFSFSGRGQNTGMAFVKLKDWKLRNRPDLKVQGRGGQGHGGLFPDPQRHGLCLSRRRRSSNWARPKGSIFSCWTAAAWAMHELMAARNQLLGMAAQDPRLTKVRPNGLEDVPEYRIDVDWEKAGALGVPITSIHNTISAAFGSAYVNDFIQGGRVKRVYVQADAPYRMLPKDLEKLYVRNTAGKMVPFSSFASGHWTLRLSQAGALQRLSVHQHLGRAGAGKEFRRGHAGHGRDSSRSCRRGSASTGPGFPTRSGMAGSQAPLLYAFSILVIFLCLAALYESWPIPISILLVLPLGVIGGVIASTLRGLPNDVYFQIGLLDHPGPDHQERHPDRPVCQEPGWKRGWG